LLKLSLTRTTIHQLFVEVKSWSLPRVCVFLF